MNLQDENIQLPTVNPTSNDFGAMQTAPVDPQTAPPTQPHSQVPANPTGSAPPVAGDVDLIEKEWVEKAKTIVNSTMGNPHEQSQQINQMKADYIKKRYNKDIRAQDK